MLLQANCGAAAAYNRESSRSNVCQEMLAAAEALLQGLMHQDQCDVAAVLHQHTQKIRNEAAYFRKRQPQQQFGLMMLNP
jgi:hypothetical protein